MPALIFALPEVITIGPIESVEQALGIGLSGISSIHFERLRSVDLPPHER